MSRILFSTLLVVFGAFVSVAADGSYSGSQVNCRTNSTPKNSNSPCSISLPSGNINFYADGGVASFADVNLSGVPTGFTVQDGHYAGWCVDFKAAIPPFGMTFQAKLYSSLDANAPTYLRNENWDLINYILNHKRGTRDEIQAAIWFITDGASEGFDSVSQSMVEEAMARGQGFIPGEGQIVAVILDANTGNPTDDQRIQKLVIELTCKGGNNTPPPTECVMNLPTNSISFYADGGTTSFADINVTNVPTGFTIQNGHYPGWCVDFKAGIPPFGTNLQGHLYSTLDANLPVYLRSDNWDLVNYILNHKRGTRDEIQAAIWFLLNGDMQGFDDVSQSLVDEAVAHGQGYIPAEGQIVAVILDANTGNPPEDQRIQRLIIELSCQTHENGGGDHGRCEDFVTGGGWIRTSRGAKATFGVEGGIKNGRLWGHLNYVDHGLKLHIRSTAVTSYTHLDDKTRVIGYNVLVGTRAGTARVTVTDNGEPGRNDIFKIEVSGGYSEGGDLGGARPGGGNIQLHDKCRGNGQTGSCKDCGDNDKGGKDGKNGDRKNKRGG